MYAIRSYYGRQGASGKERAESPAEPPQEGPIGLNQRQRKGYALLQRNGEISRSEYEELFPEGISARSALYDLQELVKRGLARKQGRGPATRYVLSRN